MLDMPLLIDSHFFRLQVCLNLFFLSRSSCLSSELLIGNLRTTTKFTMTTSVYWEKTGTRTSVLAGKRKVKMLSVGRSTTMTLNVNTEVKLWCSFAMAAFKTMQDLICSSRTSNFIDDEKCFVLSDLFEWKYTYFPYEIIQLSTWMRWPSPSVCQSLDLEKETFWSI